MRDFLEGSSFERTDCARGMTYHCEWTKESNWLVCNKHTICLACTRLRLRPSRRSGDPR